MFVSKLLFFRVWTEGVSVCGLAWLSTFPPSSNACQESSGTLSGYINFVDSVDYRQLHGSISAGDAALTFPLQMRSSCLSMRTSR